MDEFEKEELPLAVRRLKYMLEKFLPLIGRESLAGEIAVSGGGLTDWMLQIGKSGIFIEVGYEVDEPGIVGPRAVDGLRVFTMEIHKGGRWHPPEDVDVAKLVTLREDEALICVGRLLALEAVSSMGPLPIDLEALTVTEEVA
jgi:hypothetical protein